MNLAAVARWAVYLPLFTIPFLALYVADGLYFPFITGKNFVFRALVEIAFFGWIVLAVADRRYRPQFSWVLASFALLVAWMVVADSFAVNPHKAFWSNYERMDGFVTLAHVFALFLITSSVLTVDKLWRRWWLTFVGAAGLVVGYGLLQLSGAARINQGGTRVDATLGNAEYLAGYLLFALAITLWQALETRKKEYAWLRYALFALAALEVVILVATLTRGTVVALIGASVFGAVLWMLGGEARGRKYAAGVLLAAVLLVGGFFVMRTSPVVTENPNLQRFASIFSLREALGTRLTIWDMALEGAQERPLTGWGHEGYNYVFNTYYRPSLYGQEPWFDRAHNIYLDWLIAGGVPALLLFLALFGSAASLVFLSPQFSRTERVLILSVFAGYGIQGLVVFDNLFTYIPLALLLAYVHARSSRPVPLFERLPGADKQLLATAIAPAAAIAALAVLYVVNVPTRAAAEDLIRGLTPQGTAEARLGHFEQALARDPFATQEIREQLLQFAQSIARSDGVSEATKAEAVAFAEEEIQKEIARAPRDARLYIQYAGFLRSIGRYDDARAQSAKARELSPLKQSIILEQGAEAWQAGDFAAARAYFDEVYALAPEHDEAAAYAAAGRILTRDIPGAKAVLEERFGTTTVNDMVLVLAYQEIGAWDEVVKTLRLRARESADAESGYQLAIAYAQAGRLAEARAQVRAVMSAFPASIAQGTALLMQLGG